MVKTKLYLLLATATAGHRCSVLSAQCGMWATLTLMLLLCVVHCTHVRLIKMIMIAETYIDR